MRIPHHRTVLQYILELKCYSGCRMYLNFQFHWKLETILLEKRKQYTLCRVWPSNVCKAINVMT